MISPRNPLGFASVLLFALWLQTTDLFAGTEDPAIDRIHHSLQGLLESLERKDISPSPVPGLYEVVLGARLYYVSADGRYLISGRMIDLQDGRDLTEAKVSRVRKRMVDAVGEENMIVFGPADARYTVTVFTDIDCGYCRKLHSQMDGYNELGIRIRYLFYPRAGMESESARKAVAVWCAADRKKALSDAKQGIPVPYRDCENPVARHFMLGDLVGVTGTPALVLENGELLPGYLPPARLRRILDEKFPAER